jgi:hypothetical protein
VFWRSDSSWKTLVIEGDVFLFIVYLFFFGFLFGLHFLHFFWVCSSGGGSGGFELWVTSGVENFMQTKYGDIEFGFYPKVAPKTVDHIFKLVRLGAYNTNHFFRVIFQPPISPIAWNSSVVVAWWWVTNTNCNRLQP